MADDYNVNIRFSEEETFGGDTGSRAGSRDTGGGTSSRAGKGEDKDSSERKRMFQQMEWVFRAFRGVPGVGIIGTLGKDIAVNAKYSQQALGLQKSIGGGMIAGLAGVALTLFSILKQSKIATTFSAAFFQIIGAMVDMLLIPYIPLLGKIVEWLMKGFTWTAKYGQTIADLVSNIAKYIYHMLQLAIIGNPISLAIMSAIKGFDYTKEVMFDIADGLQEAKDGIINATKALFDIGKREQLTEQILDRLKEAVGKGAPIASIGSAQEALLTMPTSILDEIKKSIDSMLVKSSYATDGTVYLKEIAELANSLKNLKFPSMTPSQSVSFDKEWKDMLSAGGKIKPKDIVDLSTANLIKISDIFDLKEKHSIKVTNVIEVVGILAKQAKEVIEIVKGSEIPVNLDAMILKFSKTITVDADKVITIAKSEKTLDDFIDKVHKLLFGDYVSKVQIVLGDYIQDKDLLNDILNAAGIKLSANTTIMKDAIDAMGTSLGDKESGIVGAVVTAFSAAKAEVITLTGTIVSKMINTKNFFEQNIQPAASATATFLGEAATLASKIPGYIATAIQTQVSAQVAQLSKDKSW
ncbi:MAG: hypothetical protein Q7K55_02840, partial [Candidatus Levybacteria bacterium]|nr:hypothetical protein [Candidatus Levybacteria bacterium]